MPIVSIVKAITSVLVKQGAKKTIQQSQVMDNYLQSQLLAKRGISLTDYHLSNISNLKNESGLSMEWISDLITKSKTFHELKTIESYLSNSKNTYNLGKDNINFLKDKLTMKYEHFRIKELIQKLQDIGIDVSDLF